MKLFKRIWVGVLYENFLTFQRIILPPVITKFTCSYNFLSKETTSKVEVDKPRTSAITQLEFGQAEAQVIGARQLLWSSVAETWQKTIIGDEITIEDRKQLRLAAVQATILCTQAVDLLYNAAGGTALQGSCPLQKHFRDIHAATQHRQVSRDFLRMAGGIRLDGETPAAL